MRGRPLFIVAIAGILFLVAGTGTGQAPAPCSRFLPYELQSLVLRAPAGLQAFESLYLPGSTPDSLSWCWLTKEQTLQAKKCEDAVFAEVGVRMFGAAVRGVKDGDLEPALVVPQGTQARQVLDSGVKLQGGRLVVTYSPPGLIGRTDEAVLRLEWDCTENGTSTAKDAQYLVTGIASDYEDSRYRLSVFAGGSYLHSKEHFGKAFPEFRLLVESRILDRSIREDYCTRIPTPPDCQLHRIRVSANKYKTCDQCSSGGDLTDEELQTCLLKCRYKWSKPGLKLFDTVRIFGDVGVSGTTAAQAGTTIDFDGEKVLDASFGLGAGWRWTVSARNPERDTNRFSFLVVGRVGIFSLPEDANPDVEPLPLEHSFALRIENESGRFTGAYLELGAGQSNRFVYQPTRRMKVDTYLPVTSPGAARIALRLQVDRPLPFGDLNAPPDLGDTPDMKREAKNLLRAGEIKVSLLAAIDVRTVLDVFGTPHL